MRSGSAHSGLSRCRARAAIARTARLPVSVLAVNGIAAAILKSQAMNGLRHRLDELWTALDADGNDMVSQRELAVALQHDGPIRLEASSAVTALTMTYRQSGAVSAVQRGVRAQGDDCVLLRAAGHKPGRCYQQGDTIDGLLHVCECLPGATCVPRHLALRRLSSSVASCSRSAQQVPTAMSTHPQLCCLLMCVLMTGATRQHISVRRHYTHSPRQPNDTSRTDCNPGATPGTGSPTHAAQPTTTASL